MKIFRKNINDVSINDIFNYFKFDNNESLSSINSKLSEYIDKINNSELDNLGKNEIINEITTCRKKITDHFELKPLSFNDNNNNNNIIEESNNFVIKNHYNLENQDHSKNIDVKYSLGKVNPLFKQTYKKIINIDSLFRENEENTESTDFNIKLTNPETKVLSMKISSVEIPNQFYYLSDKLNSNTFKISVFDVSGQNNLVHKIILPPGNYYSNQMISAVNNYFNNIRGGLELLNFSIDSITAKTIIRARSQYDSGSNPKPYVSSDTKYSPNFNFKLDFSVEGLKKYETLGWFLGFTEDTYSVNVSNTYTDLISFTNTRVYKGYQSSESTYGNSINHYFFIYLDDFNRNFNSNTVTSIYEKSIISNNILGKINITEGHQTIVFNDGSDKIFKKREYYGPVNLDKLNIKLINKFGKVMDLNKNNFSLTLELEKLF